jgi:hypothetical protein
MLSSVERSLLLVADGRAVEASGKATQPPFRFCGPIENDPMNKPKTKKRPESRVNRVQHRIKKSSIKGRPPADNAVSVDFWNKRPELKADIPPPPVGVWNAVLQALRGKTASEVNQALASLAVRITEHRRANREDEAVMLEQRIPPLVFYLDKILPRRVMDMAGQAPKEVGNDLDKLF